MGKAGGPAGLGDREQGTGSWAKAKSPTIAQAIKSYWCVAVVGVSVCVCHEGEGSNLGEQG